MRALACPDSFKDVLSAAEAAAALAGGLRAAGLAADELPLADGGEGTLDVVARAVGGGEWRRATVTDPVGRPVEARFWLAADGTGLVEAAEVIGLERVRPEERDPRRASSRGLGELLLTAVAAGATRVTVALGGTATVDGGAGLREVVDELPVPTLAAHDVQNPLLGPRGAARAFGPQKGASPEDVEELERRLRAMPELAPYADTPGAGAAGGLGAAFAALGAELRLGVEVVLEAVAFRERLRAVDLVVTGEGTVDASSAEGKVPAGVARASAQVEVPVVVVGGRVTGGVAALHALGATAIVPLAGGAARTRDDLAAMGEAVGRLVLGARRPRARRRR